MSIAEFLKDPEAATVLKQSAPPVDPAVKLRKQVFTGFGAIIALGLTMTGWYVGVRVLAGLRSSQPVASAATTPAPAPPPPAAVSHPVAITAPVPPAVPSKPATTPAPTPIPTAEVTHPAAVTAAPLRPEAVNKPVAITPAPRMPSPVDAKRTAVPSASPKVVSQAANHPEIAQPVTPAQPVKRKDSVMPSIPFQRRDVNPHHGDKYLQVAAYGPRSLDAYLKTLEAQGRHPLVAPGPVDNIYRILIGPFPNTAALEEARHSIQASGIEPILRTY